MARPPAHSWCSRKQTIRHSQNEPKWGPQIEQVCISCPHAIRSLRSTQISATNLASLFCLPLGWFQALVNVYGPENVFHFHWLFVSLKLAKLGSIHELLLLPALPVAKISTALENSHFIAPDLRFFLPALTAVASISSDCLGMHREGVATA